MKGTIVQSHLNIHHRVAGDDTVFHLLNDTFFNEFTIALPKLAAGVIDELAGKDLLGGVPVSRLYPNDSGLEALLLVAATETTTDADMTMLIDGLVEVLK